MRRRFAAVLGAMLLGIAACAGSPGMIAKNNETPTCTTPHGFVLASESAGTLASDSDVADVHVVNDPEKPQQALSIRFDDAAAARLRQYTAAHVGERIVISIGDRVVARLTVRDPVEGPVLVTGSSPDDVADMRARLCGS